jgi:hypothetical protein
MAYNLEELGRSTDSVGQHWEGHDDVVEKAMA